MVELEPSRLGAAAVVGFVNIGALAAIPLVDGAFDGTGDVARGCSGLLGCTGRGTGPMNDAEPLLLQVRNEQVERAVDDAGEVALWKVMAHEVLRLPQLGAEGSAGGEVDSVGVSIQRL